jgi:hypothetical protein
MGGGGVLSKCLLIVHAQVFPLIEHQDGVFTRAAAHCIKPGATQAFLQSKYCYIGGRASLQPYAARLIHKTSSTKI